MDEPDVQKLSHWCCKSAAVGFEKGLYSQHELRIDQDSSEAILQNLRCKGALITEEMACELGRLCTLKELSIGQENAYNHLLHIASHQSLTSLSVTDPYHLGWTNCDWDEEDEDEEDTPAESTDKKEGRCYRVKLEENLFGQLGKSRESMRTFSLRGCRELSFRKDWVIAMKKALPNLTKLILEGCDLSNDQLEQLTNYYPELRYLSLIGTEVTSLISIGGMTNLRELRLRGVQFGDTKDLEELFQLQHLTDLDISGYQNSESKSAFHFIICNKVLPNLQFLDCSFNKLTIQNVRQIVRTHPKLEFLGLLGGGISRSFIDSADEVVQVLNEADLRSHCRAIQQYTRKSWHHHLHYAIDSIRRFICTNENLLPPVEIGNAISILISTLQTVDTDSGNMASCCFEGIEKVLRNRELTPVQKNDLIKALVVNIRRYATYDHILNGYTSIEDYKGYWKLLSKCMGEATIVNKRLVHALCIEQYYVKGTALRMDNFSGILEEICINDKDYKCEDMFHRQDLLDKSIEFIASKWPRDICPVAFKQIFALIIRFYELGGLYGDEDYEFKLVQRSLGMIFYYHDESRFDELKIKIRQGLKYFVIQQNSRRRQFCFEGTNFNLLMKPLTQNVAPTMEVDLRLEALVLFYTLMNPTEAQNSGIARWCDVARGFLARNTWTPGTIVFDIIMMILNDQEASELHEWANGMIEEMLAFDLTIR